MPRPACSLDKEERNEILCCDRPGPLRLRPGPAAVQAGGGGAGPGYPGGLCAADFYKYGFVGIMLDWIDKGMQEDYHKIVQMMGTALDGNIARSIENFKNVV